MICLTNCVFRQKITLIKIDLTKDVNKQKMTFNKSYNQTKDVIQ